MQHLKHCRKGYTMDNRDEKVMSGKTDERAQGDWKSRYTEEVQKIHFKEAIYILFIVSVAFVFMLLTYTGVIQKWLKVTDERYLLFTRIFYCMLSGLLGGAIFDMKWFYKAIAHGFWNADRIYWRLFTPVISLSFAFCLACIFSDNIVIHGNGFSACTLGFLTGYFSDEAVGKMAEVAKVLFNTNEKNEQKNNQANKSSSEKPCKCWRKRR